MSKPTKQARTQIIQDYSQFQVGSHNRQNHLQARHRLIEKSIPSSLPTSNISQQKSKQRHASPCIGDVLQKLTCFWSVKPSSPKSQQISTSLAKQNNEEVTLSTHNCSLEDNTTTERKFPSLLIYKDINFMTTGDKINYHLDAIEGLIVFVEQNPQKGDGDLWRELKCLLHKIYLVQRKKVQKFMRKYPIESPFRFEGAEVDTEQIVTYMNLTTGKFRLKTIKQENTDTENELLKKYNLDLDSQSVLSSLAPQAEAALKIIYKKLWEYINCLEVDLDESIDDKNLKISEALHLGFILASLNGKQIVPLEEFQKAEKICRLSQYIQKHKKVFLDNLCR